MRNLVGRQSGCAGDRITIPDQVGKISRSRSSNDDTHCENALPYDSVVEWFEAQVANSPDAMAVVFSNGHLEDNQTLSYRELDTRANQLARHLIEMGVNPEQLVGVCIERSLNMIVAILGIIKSGGAYVPLDPDYPSQRQSHMIENSRMTVLLTDRSSADRHPRFNGLIVDLDHVLCEQRQQGKSAPASTLAAEHLACVIYTSGSTGQPKGVMIKHENIVNTVLRAQDQFNLDHDSRVALFASTSFVMSVGDIFSTLCSGAALFVGSRRAMMPGDALTSFLQNNRINTICMAASSLALLSSEKLANLKHVLVAGEPCAAHVMQSWARGRNFIIGYGMTESTGGVMHRKCTDSDLKPVLGRPNPNITVHVLNEDLEPVQQGGQGELYIGGAGLARGYLHDAELTGRRFIKDPFSDDPDARLYRSGDLARHLDNGDMEFAGRADFQISLRGFRIEPGEIEAVLNQHAQVQRAVVAASKDPAGNERLVAYIQEATDVALNISSLRAELIEQLPEHMIPTTFVRLAQLPLTPNGKLDRLSLPDITQELLSSSTQNVGSDAGNDIERQVTDIFCRTLGVSGLGVTDNFFEIGADSLLLVKVCESLQKRMQIDIPVIKLFEFPTIQRLCQFLEGRLCSAESAVSGTHLVNEAAKRDDFRCAEKQLFLLSAQDLACLRAYAGKLIHHIEKNAAYQGSDSDLIRDVAYTLQVGRKAMRYRMAVFAKDLSELSKKLKKLTSAGTTNSDLTVADSKHPDQEGRITLQEWKETSEQERVYAERDLQHLSEVWLGGGDVRWQKLYTDKPARRLPLPTYPFAGHPHSLPPAANTVGFQSSLAASPDNGTQRQSRQSSLELLHFTGTWQSAPIEPSVDGDTGAILLFAHDSSLSRAVQSCKPQVRIIVVSPGQAFKQINAEHFEINPGESGDYIQLLERLDQSVGMPSRIVHCWSRETKDSDWTTVLDDQLKRGYLSMLYLGKALIAQPSKAATRLIFAYSGHDCAPPAYAAVSAFANSLMREDRQIHCQTVELDTALSSQTAALAQALLHELDSKDRAIRIRHSQGLRSVRKLQEFKPQRRSPDKLPLKQQGVYLITGGLGGLGFIFAEFLAERYQARLVLTGRSPISSGQKSELQRIESSGSQVMYVECDITDAAGVEALAQSARERFGAINGVIHSAGVIRRHFIRDMQQEDIDAVLAPKLPGTVHLDRCLSSEKLDFFALFSSISAEIEGLGLPAYAFANAFLDQFAIYRESLRAQGARHGNTVSINWPLWRHGGMQPGQQTEKILSQTLGMSLLQTDSGIDAFVQGLGAEQNHFMVVEGNAEKIRHAVLGPTVVEQNDNTSSGSLPLQPTHTSTPLDSAALQAVLRDRLCGIAAALLKRPQESIDLEETFDTYGFDSLGLTEFAGKLNSLYRFTSPLTPADFFEHATISSLSRHLLKNSAEDVKRQHLQTKPNHSVQSVRDNAAPDATNKVLQQAIEVELLRTATTLLKRQQNDIDPGETLYDYGFDSLSLTEFAGVLNERFALAPPLSPSVFFEHASISALAAFLVVDHPGEFARTLDIGLEADKAVAAPAPLKQNKGARTASIKPVLTVVEPPSVHSRETEPVAIIGMSGMLPQSDSLEQFWQHLINGDNMITEVPESRWDWRAHYGDPETENNKTNIIWGGFLNRIEAFDPLFFSISPREAEMMDPQQRLFLEASWKSIENSGYRPSQLSGSRTGVFAGITNSGYRELIARHEPAIDAYAATGTAPSMVPNRVSHLLNLHGPSEPIDTACSSSLVAVHRAVRAIQSGECDMAIAGGVNVILSPLNYIYLARAGILSPNGRCGTFDAKADGFVRGEGVGALLLKPLSQAQADGDHVHAIIRATSVNHGGHANSLSAPNTSAQAALLVDAYTRAGIDPATVSYIETHGTGTKLGDPVEINALKKAFAELYAQWGIAPPETPHCGIGSVKTNAGHLEAAAGMAGIFKTVMALDHQMLPGNLHFDEMNPYIDLSNSPFYIVDKTRPWPTLHDANGNLIPGRAGISSFGFGGANAHIVIEQYEPEKHTVAQRISDDADQNDEAAEQIFVLSAKNTDRLKAYARNLASHLGGESTKSDEQSSWRGEFARDLHRMAAESLGLDSTELGLECPLIDYGLDYTNVDAFVDRLAGAFDIDGLYSLLQTHPSLNALEDELVRHHGALLQSRYRVETSDTNGPERVAVGAPRSVDVAYTLQIGREAMPERLAIVCRLGDLAEKLKCFADGEGKASGVLSGRVAAAQELGNLLTEQPSGTQFLDSMISAGELSKAASLWVLGIDIDWSRFYGGQKPGRVPLPSYPFERKSCWVETGHGKLCAASSASNFIRSDSLPAATPEPGQTVHAAQREPSPATPAGDSGLTACTCLREHVSGVIASTLKIGVDQLDADAHLETYGLDSLIIGQITASFKAHFPAISPTVLFTCKTLNEVHDHIAQHHPQEVESLFALQSETPSPAAADISARGTQAPAVVLGNMAHASPSKQSTHDAAVDQDVAIIGVSGRFPGAPDVDTFWENLKAGNDSVTGIPSDRWNPDDYPGIYCRQGGFLEDADKFDARFFGISAERARFMSAQERLFLQTAWSCIEDAGYTREKLADPDAGDQRGDVGVFAGVSYNEYQLNAMEEWAAGNFVPVNTQICSVANRVSYFLNLRGPSLSVDTACSSSLYALHLACQSIRSGECTMAIAGGVNLSQHPAKYLTLCSIGMLSRNGRCNSFGEGGDGMTPAEAVGAVLLKPLAAARRDGDQIHAVLKGTAVNHDGKTYGYTVPNPVAQTEVISEALDKSGIDADSISYVETHGTGTALGDPIEIEGLTKAYRRNSNKQGFCAIGSAKSNIGHAEAAAGIVQVVKVLMQMRHRTLAPSILHGSDRLNPNIDFERSPFYLQRRAEPWQPISAGANNESVLPRRAGITSLGASGVNVHVIMEEYDDPVTGVHEPVKSLSGKPVIVPLSAMQPERLVAYADALARQLKHSGKSLHPADIAHTLQSGREAMKHRTAFVVRTTSELIGLLEGFAADAPAQASVNTALGADCSELEELANRWVQGETIDWSVSAQQLAAARHVSLTTYPFCKQRFWITDSLAPGADLKRIDRPCTITATAANAANEKSANSTKGQDPIVQSVVARPAQSEERAPVSAFLLELSEAPQSEQEDMIAELLQEKVALLLGYGSDEKPPLDEGFFAMGIESIQVAGLQADITEIFQIELEDTAVFDHPDIRSMAVHIAAGIPFDDILVEASAQQIVDAHADIAHSAGDDVFPGIDTSLNSAAPALSADELELLDNGPLSEEILTMTSGQLQDCLEQELLECVV